MNKSDTSTMSVDSVSPVLKQRARSTSPYDSEVLPVVLSFDVEEHHRIEAASGLEVDPGLQRVYGQRMRHATAWILEQLAARGIHATFFIVGQIALTDSKLVKSICEAGH